MSLIEFAQKYNPRTDKYDLGYMHCFYDRYFSPLKHDVSSVLEIGTAYGESVKLWRDFFPKATVFALDCNQCGNIENEERIVHIVGDAYSDSFRKTLPKNYFDIIIDDGPHTYVSMVIFCSFYPLLLKRGGIFVLEDIIDISWTPSLAKILESNNMSIEVIHTAGKQIDDNLRVRWSDGLDVIVAKKN